MGQVLCSSNWLNYCYAAQNVRNTTMSQTKALPLLKPVPHGQQYQKKNDKQGLGLFVGLLALWSHRYLIPETTTVFLKIQLIEKYK